MQYICMFVIYEGYMRKIYDMIISSAETIPLFFRNLIAEFDKRQAWFHKINLNLDSPKSSWAFPGIFLNIYLKLLIITFPESSKRFPGILVNIPRVPRILLTVPVFLVS